MDKLKEIKNLFKKLIKNEKSVFYAVDRVSRLLLSKAKKSMNKKNKVFYKYYLEITKMYKIKFIMQKRRS